MKQSILPILTNVHFFCLPESVGYYPDSADHLVMRSAGALDNFSIHLVIDGKGYVEIDDQKYTLQSGEAFLYFPKQQQTYYSSQEQPWSVYWVHFYGSQVKDFMIEQGMHRTVLWKVRNWKTILPSFEELLLEAEKNKILFPAKLSILTYSILTQFINQAQPLLSSKGNESTERITKLLPIMQEKASEPFVLEEWAERANVSPYYFCKIFRKATQMTPMNFITLCRIQLSKQLLLDRDQMTVKEVAVRSGYSSASYFNKLFLEREGLTPTAYRQLFLGRK